jgi:hypothetical protein
MEIIMAIVLPLIFAWGIGLALPTILRYLILKKPVSKKVALAISIAWYLVQLLLYGSPGKTHFPLVVISVITYYVLIRK